MGTTVVSDKSSIEWTATVNADGTVTKGATWNPVRGCTKVSPGCANCYAETFAERWRGVPGHPYEQGFDLRLVPEKLDEPLRWKKSRRVFVNSMSDLFQDGVPDEYIDRVVAVMALAPQHTFQVLTKRAERMRDYMIALDRAIRLPTTTFPRWKSEAEQILSDRGDTKTIVTSAWPLPNVWLGVSVENQHFADERIPLLLQTPAAVRFISAEPLLSHINLVQFLSPNYYSLCGRQWSGAGGIGWVIIGGESGHGARPFDLDWARDIIAQCRRAGVPVAPFFKQAGAQPYDSDRTARGRSETLHFVSKKGGDMSEWPEDLRVREFPTL